MEEHPTVKSGRLEMVSVLISPDSATKMEISAKGSAPVIAGSRRCAADSLRAR